MVKQEHLKNPTDIAQHPSFIEEKRLVKQGYRLIAGIDEVGRGPLAGPVVAAAVILPLDLDAPWLPLVHDSKKLTPNRRASLFPLSEAVAISIGVGDAPLGGIDTHGIVTATKMAMHSAVARLSQTPDFLLIDFIALPELGFSQRSITKGDSRSLSIACASIIAKVTRDRIMVELDEAYPGYGFVRHKGYATREHLLSLRQLGACPIHRKYFAPVRFSLDSR